MFRYKKLGYVALSVTDVEKSSQFYNKIVGLDLHPRTSSDQPAFLRCSSDHHNLVLYEDKEAGLKRVAFELEDESQLDVAFEVVTKAGLNPQEVTKEETELLQQGRTFRFTDPYAGLEFEMYAEMQQVEEPYQQGLVKIKRLGHAVIDVKDFDNLLGLLVDTLNFKVSDVSGEQVGWAWLRCFPNPLHHSFALVRSERTGLNHIAFNVEEIDDIGKGRNLLLREEIPILFGPGRHKPSSSLFLYFEDPDGMSVEFSQGMEEFPEEGARDPRQLEPTLETLDLWGGTPDPRFGKVGKITS